VIISGVGLLDEVVIIILEVVVLKDTWVSDVPFAYPREVLDLTW
jgi:hypothetical protein